MFLNNFNVILSCDDDFKFVISRVLIFSYFLGYYDDLCQEINFKKNTLNKNFIEEISKTIWVGIKLCFGQASMSPLGHLQCRFRDGKISEDITPAHVVLL
jgi:hypothetical protein